MLYKIQQLTFYCNFHIRIKYLKLRTLKINLDPLSLILFLTHTVFKPSLSRQMPHNLTDRPIFMFIINSKKNLDICTFNINTPLCKNHGAKQCGWQVMLQLEQPYSSVWTMTTCGSLNSKAESQDPSHMPRQQVPRRQPQHLMLNMTQIYGIHYLLWYLFIKCNKTRSLITCIIA